MNYKDEIAATKARFDAGKTVLLADCEEGTELWPGAIVTDGPIVEGDRVTIGVNDELITRRADTKVTILK
jgi:hypothetical protein